MTLKGKKIVLLSFAFIILVENIVCIIFLNAKEKEINECWFTIDSLYRLEYLRYNEESEYYGMGEKEILSYLPQPTFSSDEVVSLDDIDEFGYTSVGQYLKKNDMSAPIHIHQHVWKNLITRRNLLDVCFVKQDSVWIAVECIEYDTNYIDF